MSIEFTTSGRIAVVTINRPAVRNAIDQPAAEALAAAFRKFDSDDGLDAAILTGAAGHFCAGADLKAVAGGRAIGSRSTATARSAARGCCSASR
jgi:enoyl-CoA hydratase